MGELALTEEQTVECPFCEGTVLRSADICPHCEEVVPLSVLYGWEIDEEE